MVGDESAEERKADEEVKKYFEWFIRRHGVAKMHGRAAKIVKFLKTAPGDRDVAKRLIRRCVAHQWDWSVFDHMEVFGRNGHPFFLIGHPYSIHEDDLDMLNELRACGFNIIISNQSWYNSSTVIVEVSHPSTREWPDEPPDDFDAKLFMDYWVAKQARKGRTDPTDEF